MIMKKKTIRKYARQLLILAAGILVGRLLFTSPAPLPIVLTTSTTTWTCSMHPSIRQSTPGSCPLCGMDLVPLTAETSGDAVPNAVRLSPEALALANVRVTRVTEGVPTKEITLHGTVRADERRARVQVAHVKGRIERFFVHAPGERVREGDIIARVSSPDMHTARQELIEAHRTDSLRYPELLAAAREKLRLWKLTEEQIRETERSGVASPIVDIPADVDGVVTARRVEEGDYVVPGTVLFELADLSHLRAVFNAREGDIPYLRVGQPVDYTLTALPGRSFQGKISIVEPSLSENARVLEVRVEIPNPTDELRPGMYARATVRATLPLSPTLQVVIPSSAVLWTGPRSLVYVRQGTPDNPFFLPRSVELGPSLGDAYVVLSGLSPGEEIVTRGLFAIDASAQL